MITLLFAYMDDKDRWEIIILIFHQILKDSNTQFVIAILSVQVKAHFVILTGHES